MKNLVEEVAKIIWANENRLSDGYEFYEGGYEEAVEAVNEISEQIVRLLTKREPDLLNCPQCGGKLHNGYCQNCKAAFEIVSG